MVVFGFSGSPRQNANTDRLVQAVLAGAASAGADTRFLRPQDMDMRPCRACMWCRQNRGCAIADDFSLLWPGLYEADALVIGSPVYMWQMTAQAKTLVDRLYPVLNADFSSRLAKKPKLALCFTQGHPDGDFFKPYFEHTAQMLRFLGFDVQPTLSAVGTRAPDAIEAQTDLLEKARNMGRSLVAK
jgi:multimeric flavodoxin WrbA